MLGGLDQVAVDPANGAVFVLYGVFDQTIQGNRIAIGKFATFKSATNLRLVTFWSPVRRYSWTTSTLAALPAVAVAANGMVGVLYDTFEGMIRGLPTFVTHLAIADEPVMDL